MKKILFILSFFLLLYIPYIVEAENVYSIISEVESFEGFDAPKIAQEALAGKIGFDFSDIVDKAISLFADGIKQNLPLIIKITLIAVLSGIVINLTYEKCEAGVFASCAAECVIATGVFSYALTLATETIDTLFLFISSMMPSVAASLSLTGVAFGGVAASTFISMQVFIHICKNVILPLICVICVFSVCDKLGKTPYLEGISALLKQVLKWGSGFLIIVYGVVTGLSAQAAVNMDNLAGKSLKYAIGSFVPVVGGALSDSLDTVIAGGKTVAGALGITGIIGVGYLCIVPLVNICVVSLSFRLAGAVASVSAEKRVFRIVDEFSQCIAKIAIVLLSVVVMFVISLSVLCSFGGK